MDYKIKKVPKINSPIYSGLPLINADSTASGRPLDKIEKFIQNKLNPYYSNTHSNAYSGRLMANWVKQSKKIICNSLNCNEDDKIIFTGSGCTAAIKHFMHLVDINNKNNKPFIINSKLEHLSNYLPWKHCELNRFSLDINPDGMVKLNQLEKELKKAKKNKHNPIIVSVSACSNVIGVKQPLDEISKITHKYGGIFAVDYACSAPYVKINMHKDDKLKNYYDAVFISPHKFLGGTCTPGLLVINKNIIKNTEPFYPGGGTVRFVCSKFQKYSDDIEKRETGGTPNIVGSIKTGLVFQAKELLMDTIHEREEEIKEMVDKEIKTIPNITILNPVNNPRRIPIYAIIVDKLHYNLVVALLSDLFGIQVRGGVSCANILAQTMLNITNKEQKKIYEQIVSGNGVPSNYGWVRISFNYQMSDKIVWYILNALRIVCENNDKIIKSKKYKYNPEKNHWNYKNKEPAFPELNIMNECNECDFLTLSEQLLDGHFEKVRKWFSKL